MRKFLCILICTTLLVIFDSGCTAQETSSGIFDYTAKDAELTMVFTSSTGDVECHVTRTCEKIVMRVTSPAELAHLTIEIGENGCVITSLDIPLSLSGDASRGLISIFDLLYRGNTETQNVRRSADGLETVVTYSDGAVTLGEDLLPASVSAAGMDGEMRTVRILWYSTADMAE